MTEETQEIKGYIVVDHMGNTFAAAKSIEDVKTITNGNCAEGTPNIKPEQDYVYFRCDDEFLKYFALRSPNPIKWIDICFSPDGIAQIRSKRKGKSDSGYLRQIGTKPRTYYIINSLKTGKVDEFMDEIVNFYIENHPNLYDPLKKYLYDPYQQNQQNVTE